MFKRSSEYFGGPQTGNELPVLAYFAGTGGLTYKPDTDCSSFQVPRPDPMTNVASQNPPKDRLMAAGQNKRAPTPYRVKPSMKVAL